MKDLVQTATESAETKLLAEVPAMVRGLAPAEPIFCVFLLYDDGTSGDPVPSLQVGLKSLLDACQAERIDGIGDRSNAEKAWVPQQTISAPFPGFPCPTIPLDIIAEEADICYRHGVVHDGPPELPPLDPVPPAFRSMLQRVARKLNDEDAFADLPTTEHFVVLANDYLGDRLKEDVALSLSPQRHQQLTEVFPSLKR